MIVKKEDVPLIKLALRLAKQGAGHDVATYSPAKDGNPSCLHIVNESGVIKARYEMGRDARGRPMPVELPDDAS